MARQDQDDFADEDFPSLFLQADGISLRGQSKYLRLTIADLIVLMLGAVLSAFSPEGLEKEFLIASAVLLALGTLMAIWLSKNSFKLDWYGGRGIAESVKSLSWHYMMSVVPFDQARDEGREQFRSHVQEIKDDFERRITKKTGDAEVLPTDAMEALREAGLERKKHVYLKSRLQDQKDWYTKKAKGCAKLERRWFHVIVGAQALAMIIAVVMIFYVELGFNATGIFSTLAAAALAWLQVKQYEELSHSYSMTANKLGGIERLLEQTNTDTEFSRLVLASEAAMSKEHGNWLIKKDQDLP